MENSMEIENAKREDKEEKVEHFCIFEKRYCKYAQKIDKIFECKAPSDEEMIC